MGGDLNLPEEWMGGGGRLRGKADGRDGELRLVGKLKKKKHL